MDSVHEMAMLGWGGENPKRVFWKEEPVARVTGSVSVGDESLARL